MPSSESKEDESVAIDIEENRKILVNRRQFVITFGELGRLYCGVNAASSLMTLNLHLTFHRTQCPMQQQIHFTKQITSHTMIFATHSINT